jgi:PTS system nitrogen regulatory IIA component
MYLNLIQVSESFGVAEKVVEDWIRREGMPHVSDRGRLLFDRAQVADWAAGHGLTARAGFLAPERAMFASGPGLGGMLERGGIWRGVAPGDAMQVLERVLDALPHVQAPVRALLKQRLHSANGINWAPVGGGVALPHFRSRVALGRDAGVIALLLLNGPLVFQEPPPDGMPVVRLFFFVPPSPRAHLDTLALLSRAISRGSLRSLLEGGASDQVIFEAFHAVEAKSGRA